MAGLTLVVLMAVLGYGEPLIERYVTHFSYEEQHPEFALQPPGTQDISRDYSSFDGEGSHFDALDRNGDGFIGGDRELRDLYWIDRFFMFLFDDYDGVLPLIPSASAPKAVLKPIVAADNRISFDEFPVGFRHLNAQFSAEFFDHSADRFALAVQQDTSRLEGLVEERFRALGLRRADVFSRIDRDDDKNLTQDEVNEYRRCFRPFEKGAEAVATMDVDGDGRIARHEFLGAPELHTFFLGTDHLGRDVLTRLVYGARLSITIALLATAVSFFIGVTWGAIAGYYGGRVDNIMMRTVDVMYGLPFLFIVVLLMVVFGRSTINLFIALGAVQWLTMSRVVRGQIITLKEREFVEAAEVMGVSRMRIVFRHLLPNTVGPVIVYSTLMVPAIILEEAFLSFLGLGVQPPHASWGLMITEGVQVMETAGWLLLYPSIFLGLTLFSMNMVGDGIRDALDPQLERD
jgi:oligopeptide transport system permease protein